MLDYEMALKLNSQYGLAYFNMGNVYFHHRQFQQVTCVFQYFIYFVTLLGVLITQTVNIAALVCICSGLFIIQT